MHGLRPREADRLGHLVDGQDAVHRIAQGGQLREAASGGQRRARRRERAARRRAVGGQSPPGRREPLGSPAQDLEQRLDRQGQRAELRGDLVPSLRHPHLAAREHGPEAGQQELLVHGGQRLDRHPSLLHRDRARWPIGIADDPLLLRPVDGPRREQPLGDSRRVARQPDGVDAAFVEVQPCRLTGGLVDDLQRAGERLAGDRRELPQQLRVARCRPVGVRGPAADETHGHGSGLLRQRSRCSGTPVSWMGQRGAPAWSTVPIMKPARPVQPGRGSSLYIRPMPE